MQNYINNLLRNFLLKDRYEKILCFLCSTYFKQGELSLNSCNTCDRFVDYSLKQQEPRKQLDFLCCTSLSLLWLLLFIYLLLLFHPLLTIFGCWCDCGKFINDSMLRNLLWMHVIIKQNLCSWVYSNVKLRTLCSIVGPFAWLYRTPLHSSLAEETYFLHHQRCH